MLTPTPIATVRLEDGAGEEAAAVESVDITGAPVAVPLEDLKVKLEIALVETASVIGLKKVCEVEGMPEDGVCSVDEVVTKEEIVVVDEFDIGMQHCTSIGPGQYPLATPPSVKISCPTDKAEHTSKILRHCSSRSQTL